ncbi:5569_t:CDS:10 [Ambispora leptoticha]|uniref:5569_t:CDS:1 n=1 Tax=Ambispora leptoticha TaxID=144679 RepID=A0A9N8W0Y2_9GLOM|nr:5569_t:CDS:10 [Ambispora leptoticha]
MEVIATFFQRIETRELGESQQRITFHDKTLLNSIDRQNFIEILDEVLTRCSDPSTSETMMANILCQYLIESINPHAFTVLLLCSSDFVKESPLDFKSKRFLYQLIEKILHQPIVPTNVLFWVLSMLKQVFLEKNAGDDHDNNEGEDHGYESLEKQDLEIISSIFASMLKLQKTAGYEDLKIRRILQDLISTIINCKSIFDSSSLLDIVSNDKDEIREHLNLRLTRLEQSLIFASRFPTEIGMIKKDLLNFSICNDFDLLRPLSAVNTSPHEIVPLIRHLNVSIDGEEVLERCTSLPSLIQQLMYNEITETWIDCFEISKLQVVKKLRDNSSGKETEKEIESDIVLLPNMSSLESFGNLQKNIRTLLLEKKEYEQLILIISTMVEFAVNAPTKILFSFHLFQQLLETNFRNEKMSNDQRLNISSIYQISLSIWLSCFVRTTSTIISSITNLIKLTEPQVPFIDTAVLFLLAFDVSSQFEMMMIMTNKHSKKIRSKKMFAPFLAKLLKYFRKVIKYNTATKNEKIVDKLIEMIIDRLMLEVPLEIIQDEIEDLLRIPGWSRLVDGTFIEFLKA